MNFYPFSPLKTTSIYIYIHTPPHTYILVILMKGWGSWVLNWQFLWNSLWYQSSIERSILPFKKTKTTKSVVKHNGSWWQEIYYWIQFILFLTSIQRTRHLNYSCNRWWQKLWFVGTSYYNSTVVKEQVWFYRWNPTKAIINRWRW